jgi:hypothetical protein
MDLASKRPGLGGYSLPELHIRSINSSVPSVCSSCAKAMIVVTLSCSVMSVVVLGEESHDSLMDV